MYNQGAFSRAVQLVLDEAIKNMCNNIIGWKAYDLGVIVLSFSSSTLENTDNA